MCELSELIGFTPSAPMQRIDRALRDLSNSLASLSHSEKNALRRIGLDELVRVYAKGIDTFGHVPRGRTRFVVHRFISEQITGREIFEREFATCKTPVGVYYIYSENITGWESFINVDRVEPNILYAVQFKGADMKRINMLLSD